MINCFVIVRVKRGSIHLTLNYAELLQKMGEMKVKTRLEKIFRNINGLKTTGFSYILCGMEKV